MLRNLRLLLLVSVVAMLVFSLGIAGCNRSPQNIEGVTWVLVSYGDPDDLKAALTETEVTAVFDREEKRLGGSGGCNSYGASYVIDGDQIGISDIFSTKKACVSPIGAQENTYFNLLREARSFRRDNRRVTIFSGDDVLNFAME